jgi:hypothetical protein
MNFVAEGEHGDARGWDMDKIEIARRQIHGAIRCYFLRGDPVVLASLTAPASQILRDLNKNNPRAPSTVFTELAVENNCRPSQFWKAFNETANVLKHGNDPSERLDFDLIASQEDQMGAICFCVGEYFANTGVCSRHMISFGNYLLRRKGRNKIAKWPVRAVDMLDRRFTSWRLDVRTAFYQWLLGVLTRAKSRLEQSRASR